MINPALHGPATNIWLTPWNAVFFGKAGLGITGLTNNMSYYVQVISSDFAGYAKITQLCTLSGSGFSSVSNYLDNANPYPGAINIVNTNLVSPLNGHTNNLINLDDAPQNGGLFSFSLTGSFVDYLMFTPNGGSSIYVPLGKLTWSTALGASYPSTNLSPNSVSGPTAPDASYVWPVWDYVFSNPN